MLAVYLGNLLMFTTGTVITWSSSEVPKLTNSSTTSLSKKLTSEEETWVVSLMTLGAAIGPFPFAYLADQIGRKNTFLFLTVPFIVCHSVMAFVNTVELFYLARFVTGLAAGGVLTIMPVYTSEIADKKNRAVLNFLTGVAASAGMLFSCAIGPYVSIRTFNMILTIFPLTFLVLFSLFGAEVPHYYIAVNKEELAKKVLVKLRGVSDDTYEELREIQSKIQEGKEGTFLDIFMSRGLIKAFFTTVILFIFQQFSGINAVIFYAQSLFREINPDLEAEVCAIIVLFVLFLSSFLAPMIGDKISRKTLLICSALGMLLSEAALGAYCYFEQSETKMAFVPVLTLTVFVISYSSGYGPVPWMMVGELFPIRVKSITASIIVCVHWMLAFFITKYFEAMLSIFGTAMCFWIFGGCCFFAALFAKFCVVETRGKSLQEIQDILNR